MHNRIAFFMAYKPVPFKQTVMATLLLLSACQGTTTNGNADMTVIDARRSQGNESIGKVCDDRNLCAKDAKGNDVRCASARPFDAVGFCAPSCTVNADCDTGLPGIGACANMGGKSECVLFCDRQHLNTKKDCPTDWTCELVQNFYTCVPPQTRLSAPDM